MIQLTESLFEGSLKIQPLIQSSFDDFPKIQPLNQSLFDDFLKIFNLKMADYTSIDVKNAFKLLAKDDDKHISLESIKEILKKNNMSKMDVHFITTQLLAFTENGKVNYDQFLKNLSI